MWIENGELAYPVEEITVAGNLKDMLNNISEIGNDLEFRSSTAVPTLRIDGMTSPAPEAALLLTALLPA